MFGIYFGKYLMEEGVLTAKQYDDLIEQTKSSRVQLGLLAVEMGFMTEDQADEINQMQQTADKRFGDLAIEQGYLTEEDVADLLEKQGDPYLLFIQVLVEGGIMTIDEIREELVVYRKKNNFSLMDMDAIKAGDVDNITPIFINDNTLPSHFWNYIMLMSRNMVRFIDRFFRMDKMERIDEIEVPKLAMQHVGGDYSFYTILCGEEKSIDELAQAFARTSFNVYEEVSWTLDATKEFLHCNNGLFLTELKRHSVKIDLDLPATKDTPTKISSYSMYRIPYYISNQRLDLVVCADDGFQMQDV